MKVYKSFSLCTLITTIILCSCFSSSKTQNSNPGYYVGETSGTTIMYASASPQSQVIDFIPVGKQLLIKKRYKKYYAVLFNNNIYYVYYSNLIHYRKYDALTDKTVYLSNLNNSSTTVENNASVPSGSSGSSSSSTSSGGTVHVRGYTRSNGTYVAPYTRSAPSRGGHH
jgi:hypothetical protein